jgi:hypothetical protein
VVEYPETRLSLDSLDNLFNVATFELDGMLAALANDVMAVVVSCRRVCMTAGF